MDTYVELKHMEILADYSFASTPFTGRIRRRKREGVK
jgi:hypothetical protein